MLWKGMKRVVGLVLKEAMMQDGGLNRRRLCRHRRVFSGFLLCFTFSMGKKGR